eukprot:jgi/Tetstr1/434952/TSEL_023946.t1
MLRWHAAHPDGEASQPGSSAYDGSNVKRDHPTARPHEKQPVCRSSSRGVRERACPGRGVRPIQVTARSRSSAVRTMSGDSSARSCGVPPGTLWPGGSMSLAPGEGLPSGAVVAGVLNKWLPVRGWRPRLFVCDGEVLRYYKYHGENHVNVHELLLKLQREGTVQIIGTELSRQQALSRREKAKPYGAVEPLPHGEIHLQVSNLRTSQVDVKKFYLHSGLGAGIPLRAESRDDRRVWLNVIMAGKGQTMLMRSRSNMVPELLPDALRASTSAAIPPDASASRFKAVMEELVKKLKLGGVNMELIEHVEKVFSQEHMVMCDLLGEEMEKRRQLVAHMAQVEDDKRLLETAIVVGANKAAWAATTAGSGNGDLDGDSASSTSGPDMAAGEVHESSDEDDIVFFDCNPSRRHSRDVSREEDEFLGLSFSGASASSTTSTPAKSPGGGRGSSFGSPKPVRPRLNSMTDVTWSPEDALALAEAPQRRSRLPPPKEREKSVSLWSIIRECIGKDLTRICLPVFFNEPISALQKSAEDMEYSELLDVARKCEAGSQARLMYVAAFAASSYSSTVGRTRKPFNPLLGETFEFVSPEKGLRYISEKVCHHPTILTACCQGRGWLFEGDGEVKSKFWGRCIELHPVGTLQVTFADGEVYHWNKVVTSINNLIIGKLSIDHGGVMRVVNKTTGMQAKLRFKETGFMDRNPHGVKGHFEDSAGVKLASAPAIYGKWDEFLSAVYPGGEEEVIWQANPTPDATTNK